MTARTTVKKIKSLKNLSVFADWSAKPDTPELKPENLIYGFNRSGKTTLSRIFASLGSGVISEHLSPNCAFSIELTDGTVITSKKNLDALKERVAVFNEDFIANNLRWKDGTANPVFYIGKEQAELAKQLEKAQAELIKVTSKLDQDNKNLADANKLFASHKTTQARTIEDAINRARKYNATNLTSDYADTQYGKELILSEQALTEAKRLIIQQAPLPKLPLMVKHNATLEKDLKETRDVLIETIGTLSLKELQSHAEMIGWAKEGLEYHQNHKLIDCLLCGNVLSEDRRELLRNSIDGTYNILAQKIQSLEAAWKQFKDRLDAMSAKRHSENDVAKEYVGRYQQLQAQLRQLIQTGYKAFSDCDKLIKEKSKSPNSIINATGILSLENASKWDAELSAYLIDENALIEAHNAAFDNFSSSQNKAKDKIREHYLAEGEEQYRKNETKVLELTGIVNALEAEVKALTDQTSSLQAQVRQHGPAADKMNELLSHYLRHEQLKIVSVDDGYKILRDGHPIDGPLCEGEKTAIALCYFLSTLQADKRKIENLIVVIDDPVSSLDTRALNVAFSLIKGAISKAPQFILLTHNINFMNEVKKWLRNKTKEGKAAMLFLDIAHQSPTSPRTADIIVMPRLIRDYESEYHYLFERVLMFAESPNEFVDYAYLMPNALRKVLDMYLAFKVPGATGLAGKLEHKTITESGVPLIHLQALDRLVQAESHADNLDDFVSLSSMTLEETKDAAKALMSLVKQTDGEHFTQMHRLCTRATGVKIGESKNIKQSTDLLGVIGSLGEKVSEIVGENGASSEAEELDGNRGLSTSINEVQDIEDAV